jgi:hypothetical protein
MGRVLKGVKAKCSVSVGEVEFSLGVAGKVMAHDSVDLVTHRLDCNCKESTAFYLPANEVGIQGCHFKPASEANSAVLGVIDSETEEAIVLLFSFTTDIWRPREVEVIRNSDSSSNRAAVLLSYPVPMAVARVSRLVFFFCSFGRSLDKSGRSFASGTHSGESTFSFSGNASKRRT